MDIELHCIDGLSIANDTVEGESTPVLKCLQPAYNYPQSKLSLSQDSSFLDEKAKSSLKLGLFSYPVLQAADVLVHRLDTSSRQ